MWIRRIAGVLSLLLLTVPRDALCADEPRRSPNDRDSRDAVEFSLTSYAWAPSFKGDTGVKGISAPVDASFEDYADSLQGAFLLAAEARRGSWGLVVDGVWMRLEDDVGTPGPYLSSIETRMDMVLLEAALAYRIWSAEQVAVDVLVGARYVDARVESQVEPDLSAIGTVSTRVVDTAGEALHAAVGQTISSKKEEIAGNVSWGGGSVDEQVRAAIDGVRLQPEASVVTDEVALRGGRLDGATPEAEVRAFSEAVGDAVAEHAAAQLARLPPGQQHNPEVIRAAVSRSAALSLNELKSEVSGQARSAIETAEAALHGKVAEGMTKAAKSEITVSRDWVDPFVGLRLRVGMTKSWSVIGYGDIGGFGVGSELTWQLFGGLSWQVSPRVAVEFGYRHLDIDYDHDNFLLDMAMSGGAIGVRLAL